MKTLYIAVGLGLLIVGGGGIAWRVHAQSGPVQMTHDDLMLYQRDKARILLIQAQNKGLTDEFNGLTIKWCGAAHAPLDHCDINEDSGLVRPLPTK